MSVEQSIGEPMRLHYLSPEFIHAERVPPSKLEGKLKAGWQLRRLVPGFGVTGGMAHYSRALVSPHGVVAVVSDRAEHAEPADSLPVLEISYELVLLKVSFAEKDEAKRIGAVWVQGLNSWACAPDRIEDFRRWIQGEPKRFDLLKNQ